MKKVICFHNPDEENAFLSNWSFSDFEKKPNSAAAEGVYSYPVTAVR